MGELSVIVADEAPAQTEGYLSGEGARGGRVTKTSIDASTLRNSMAALSENIGEIFKDLKQVGQARLREVSVFVEISAEGGVSLIGTAKTGAKGAVTLTFELPGQ